MKHKIKKIDNLKDIKDYLSEISDDDLEQIFVGHNFEGDAEITLLAAEEEVFPVKGNNIFERADVNLFESFIRLICTNQVKIAEEDDDILEDGAFIVKEELK